MAAIQETSAISKPQRSKAGYWLAILLVVAGVIAAGFTLFRTLSATVGDLRTVTMPGTHVLTLNDSGRYTVFVEYESALGSESGIADLNLAVLSPVNEPLSLDRPEGSFSYTLGARTGEAVFQFDAAIPGEYTLVGEYRAGGPEVVIAVGTAFASRLFAGVGLSLLLPLVIWTIAAAIAVRTYLRRKRRTA